MRLFAPPTADEWFFIGIVLFLVVMLVVAAELVRRLMNGRSEVTRKFVHVVSGILMAISPSVFTSGIPVMLIALVAIGTTFVAIRRGALQSLHATDRVSYGTVFHPLAFLVLVLLLWDSRPDILSASIIVLAVPDALAALAGQRLPGTHRFPFSNDRKTVEGSTAMFLSTLTVVGVYLLNTSVPLAYSWYVVAVIVASVVTAWELICENGFDNLSVPFSTAFMLHYFTGVAPHQQPEQLAAAVLFAAGIGLLSFLFNFLSVSGSIATFLLAVVVYGVGGWMWTVPILTFFVASSLLSKFGKRRKRKLERIFEKSDKRDAGQVAANGGVAGLLVLIWYMLPDRQEIYLYYLAALAAVTADTWGTEIGTLFKGKPRSITTFRTVDVGTSGGVSIAGLAGGAAGALLVTLSALPFSSGTLSVRIILSVVLSGVAGSVADSILGATLQAQYRTKKGVVTEKTVQNGEQNTLVRGLRWFDNDLVNWCCGAIGAAVMYLLL